MIIIETKTGQILVNEKEIVSVMHNREAHTVYISKPTSGMMYRQPPIEQVESVNYINDQTGTEWKDSGSEIEYLRRQMESLKHELSCQTEIINRAHNRLRSLGHECVQWVQYYHEHMPKELCGQMRDRGEQEKSYVNDRQYYSIRAEWMQQHKKPEQIEADEVARLNTTIEEQAAQIRQLYHERDQLKARQKIEKHTEDATPSWWQRFLNWF